MQERNNLKPVNLVPFRLHDISDFVIDKHPIIYPDSEAYDRYWIPQIENCITGKWGFDGVKKTGLGGYRWIPGNLYFYVNMGLIRVGGDENTSGTKRPNLRDVEWLLFYGLTICDGFSGFSGDKEYCCFRPVGNLQSKQPLTELDKLFLDKYGHLYKYKGNYKKYIDAKEYLYRTVKEPLGHPMYHNTALNMEVLSTRRLGKSYSIADGVITYDFTFNGARTLDDYLEKKTSTTVVVGSTDYKKYGSILLNKVELCYDNLRTNIGAYNKDGVHHNGCLWHPTDLFSKKFKEGGGAVSNAVFSKSGQGREGVGSEIVHVSYKDNASAGVGHGARRMVVEEAGLAGNFSAIHGENSATQKHSYKYGYSVYIGTGGNVEKIKEIRDSFYNPGKYEMLSYPNVFNPGGNPTALFFPSYYKNDEFRDGQGNLDVERSFRYELEERNNKKGSNNYQKHIISFPMLPQEMFMQSAGNRFNTEALEDRIIELEEGDFRYSVGSLTYVDTLNNKVSFKEDLENKLEPLLRRGDETTTTNKHGALVVFEHPASYKPDRYSRNPLYLALYDPVSLSLVDGEGGSSLCSVVVIKLFDFVDNQYLMLNVVAEWHGRYDDLDDNHNMAFKIADYYGCKLFPEVNDDDILRYATRIRRHHDLEDKPDMTASEFGVQKRKYAKGFAIPPNGIPKLEEYLNDWLDSTVYKEEEIERDEFTVRTIKVINKIPSIRICEELKDYQSQDNFDAVSALMLGGLYLRSKRLEPISETSERVEESEATDFSEFFGNYSHIMNHPAYNF